MRDILVACGEGARKRHIMSNVHLSYEQVQNYLPALENLQLLNNEGDIYKTTEKGSQYITEYNELERLSSELQKKKEILKVFKD